MSADFSHYYAVIMAGGGGTRLWPLSRRDHPKQLVRLFGERSLFQIAVERLDGLFPPERIYVVTVQEQVEALRAQCPHLPAENYLIEPQPRGTASVVGYAAIALRHRDPQAVMAVLTADHVIRDEERFRQTLRAAFHVARRGYLVTLGIQPTFPATGYGYIQQGERLEEFDGLVVHRVQRFKEKPQAEQARAMLAAGGHYWNSGMFIWQVETILAEIARQMPELYQTLTRIAADWPTPRRMDTVRALWPHLQSQTVDYGIMEGAERVAVLPAADLGWSDVGSWDALFDLFPTDEHGNVILHDNHLTLDTHNALLFSNGSDRLLVTVGVEDLIVVDTGDVLLVCRKDQAQKVRQVVRTLNHHLEKYR